VYLDLHYRIILAESAAFHHKWLTLEEMHKSQELLYDRYRECIKHIDEIEFVSPRLGKPSIKVPTLRLIPFTSLFNLGQ
jgi:hypothetical protein